MAILLQFIKGLLNQLEAISEKYILELKVNPF